jgi:hypothetical protein
MFIVQNVRPSWLNTYSEYTYTVNPTFIVCMFFFSFFFSFFFHQTVCKCLFLTIILSPKWIFVCCSGKKKKVYVLFYDDCCCVWSNHGANSVAFIICIYFFLSRNKYIFGFSNRVSKQKKILGFYCAIKITFRGSGSNRQMVGRSWLKMMMMMMMMMMMFLGWCEN